MTPAKGSFHPQPESIADGCMTTIDRIRSGSGYWIQRDVFNRSRFLPPLSDLLLRARVFQNTRNIWLSRRLDCQHLRRLWPRTAGRVPSPRADPPRPTRCLRRSGKARSSAREAVAPSGRTRRSRDLPPGTARARAGHRMRQWSRARRAWAGVAALRDRDFPTGGRIRPQLRRRSGALRTRRVVRE